MIGTDLTAEQLATCNASAAWVATMLAARPFPDDAALLAAGERAVGDLPWTEVLAALDAHPRIGDRVTGDGAEAAASRREQATAAGAGDDVRAALREGNAAYEQRFGHVFLIRAAGRTGEEVLAELHRRLRHGPDEERAEVRTQLAAITRLRLEGVLAG